MSAARYTEFFLRSADGTRLFTREWSPSASPKAWVTLCHGSSEHGGRYQPLARMFNDAGYGLLMADLRGSGQSEGKRGHIERFSQYCDDFSAAVAHTRRHAPAAHFLGGHSLGGLIAAHLAVDNPVQINGVFLSGAAFQLGFEPAAWKLAASRLLARLCPSLPLSNEIDVALLSRDPDVVRQQAADPCNHGKVTPRMYLELVQAQQNIMPRASALQLPLLVMHGGADAITSPQGSERFYGCAGSRNKTLKIYDGMYHEIFNERGGEQVITEVVEWMNALLPEGAQAGAGNTAAGIVPR